ncbi:MAG: alpha/beta hydrolase [Erythrobacter sp.]
MKWVLRILGAVFAVIFIALIVMRVPDTDPAQMRAKYGGEPSQYIELSDGLTVHLRDEGPKSGAPEDPEGDAPAIILLHGSNADLSTWDAWADDLSQDYRVIRYDQIGHGLTGPATNDDYQVESFTQDLDEIADRLELDSFVLAGNSMGGAIAMHYAITHPARLDGLVLVDAGGAAIKQEGGGNLAFTLARIPGLSSVLATVMPRSLADRSLRQSVSNQDIVTEEMVDRYWEMARYPGNRAATLKRFSTPRSALNAGDVAAVTVPTLVMWGEEDSLIRYEAAKWYMDQLPNATLANYPGIGHLPHEEAADATIADLRAWLAGLQPAE